MRLWTEESADTIRTETTKAKHIDRFCPAETRGGGSHEHGAADEDEEVEAVLVGEQGVPDADDVGQQELLGEQQGQPAEGEILRLDVLLLLFGEKTKNQLEIDSGGTILN